MSKSRKITINILKTTKLIKEIFAEFIIKAKIK